MGFKEQVAADVAATFLNAAEFADSHVIDGKSVLAVIESDSDQEFDGEASEAVFVNRKRLFCREEDLEKPPRQGKRMVIDGEPYLCLSVFRETGMLEIVLTDNVPG